MSQPNRDSLEKIIPARVVIGVTGHRIVDAEPTLITRIRSVIESIREMVPTLQNTHLVLSALSPLAEGADRLVARQVLNTPDSMLEVVLPLEKDDYVKDFKTSQSKAEFEHLLSEARHVRQLTATGSRDEAYERVGRYTVDHCDVLVAIWDGKHAAGQGGTGDIVQYARERNCPLFWIHTEDEGQVTVDVGRGLSARQFEDLDVYNSERVDIPKFEKQLKGQCDSLVNQANRANLPSKRLQPTFEYVLGHYVRADLLALRYQHLYHRAGNLVYILAAAAIVLAAFQVLLLPDQPWILIAEVVFMVAILAVVWLGRRRRWHTKWIDYRFLAERFRSALFMDVANIDVAALRPPRHLSLSYSSNDWMVAAFLSVWSRRPRSQERGSISTKGLTDFLCEAWIEDQIRYHENTSRRHYRRHQRMFLASNVLFGLTLVAALLHVVHIGPQLLHSILALLAIACPAAAGGTTAIRTHRDYLRNSMRSAEMVRHLKELEDRITRAEDRETLLRLVAEIEQTMLHENEDWRVVVRFHIPELPA